MGHAIGDDAAVAAEIAEHRREWLRDVRDLRLARERIAALVKERADYAYERGHATWAPDLLTDLPADEQQLWLDAARRALAAEGLLPPT